MQVIIATNNLNKVREIKSIFKDTNIEFKTMGEIGCHDDIVEDGNSFSENAIIKAKYISKKYNCIAMSDDSGLEVEALGGAPGIYSARYASTHIDSDNNALLLKNLKGVENRRANYTCSICVYYPNDEYVISEGKVYGTIIDEARGENGFGYDPYFYIEEFHKTFAEVDLAKKNTISHRARALRGLREKLDENFNIIR